MKPFLSLLILDAVLLLSIDNIRFPKNIDSAQELFYTLYFVLILAAILVTSVMIVIHIFVFAEELYSKFSKYINK